MLMGKVSIVSAVWTVAVLATVGSHSAAHAGSNIIYQINANGSAVVLQTISTLQQSGVFENDNELLRRIAYVETRDGKLINANHGGIWAVREDRFVQAQHLENGIQLPDNFQHIRTAFGINWTSVQWRDLRIPLYSAIAARFVLYLAPHTIPPANDLEAQARFWVQHYNTDGNENDFIGVANALQGGILDSSANEFFLGFSLNHNGSNVTLHLFITTTESDPVRFTVNATGFSYSGIVTQSSSTNVTLPNSLQVSDASERNKGIYVKAEGDRKIVVYGLNYRLSTTDAFFALPCNHLPINEYEYYAVTYRPDPAYVKQNAFLIIGCEDNTLVNTGQSTFIILNRLQTYLITNNSPDDLTGRRITSNKPIAVFSNYRCANVPVNVSYCDHLTEQIPPTVTWGRIFLAASLLGRRSGEIFRIVAAQTPTNVTVNCTTFTQPATYSLTAAVNWQEFSITLNSFCSIIATAPILVVQFTLGFRVDNITGDPFMMLIPPVEQFNTNSYVFFSPPTFSLNYITVYVEPEYFQPERIFVNEASLSNSVWSQIRGCSNVCGYITRVNLMTAGDHRLYHLDQDARLGVSVYGFRKYGSYGYPGGMNLTPLQLPIFSFSSANYRYDEEIGGTQITITHSGNRETPAVVLVASNNVQVTTCNGSMPVSSVLEFQPGEIEKQITIKFDMIQPRIELYLSAGEGVYLAPFPRTEIIADGLPVYKNYSGACVCLGLNCSCLCSPTTLSTGYDDGTKTTLLPTTEYNSRSFCSWCLIITAAVFSATVVGVIIVIVLIINVCVIKKKKQSSDKKDVVEMQKCEAYDTMKYLDQGCKIGMEDNVVYDEVDAFYDTCN